MVRLPDTFHMISQYMISITIHSARLIKLIETNSSREFIGSLYRLASMHEVLELFCFCPPCFFPFLSLIYFSFLIRPPLNTRMTKIRWSALRTVLNSLYVSISCIDTQHHSVLIFSKGKSIHYSRGIDRNPDGAALLGFELINWSMRGNWAM